MKRTMLRPDQERELDDFFNGSSGDSRSPLGFQLERMRDGTASCDFSSGDSGDDMRRLREGRQSRKMRTILGSLHRESPTSYVVLELMYTRFAHPALREFAPLFGGDHSEALRAARIAVSRMVLVAPGDSGVWQLSQLRTRADGGDKDAKRRLAEIRSEVEGDMREARRKFVDHYIEWVKANARRKAENKQRVVDEKTGDQV